ncbi:cytochrome P450 [Haloferula helveola]|uniref:Cytochrome P450 n=1 Tax=Haloferula helveola TaxID=490095 RepID=A0ABM7R849_9BACT|nr:cytochrome P450 [Haloferula helveola]
MNSFCPHDPFRSLRESDGVMANDFDGERIPMILRHADLREAAKDWEIFSSDAPFRVPIPSEEDMRRMRQLPIETDPPDHADYRAIVEPFFRRALKPEVADPVRKLIGGFIDRALDRESIEIVHDFALPIQSQALTHLLNVPESEADIWIGWGTHVFREGDGGKKGQVLEDYISGQFDRAEEEPGEDFFSALTQATFRGRRLTREEMMGYANLAFAGGRDTIINSIAGIVAYFGDHPEALGQLRGEPKKIVLAVEEFVRVMTPLTHIGRVCPVGTNVHGEEVAAGHRVALCWASANFDSEVFESPHEVQLDRKPNPHVAYGVGNHFCLGAFHARLVLRSLVAALCDRVTAIDVLEAMPKIEREAEYERRNGYESLKVRMLAVM